MRPKLLFRGFECLNSFPYPLLGVINKKPAEAGY